MHFVPEDPVLNSPLMLSGRPCGLRAAEMLLLSGPRPPWTSTERHIELGGNRTVSVIARGCGEFPIDVSDNPRTNWMRGFLIP